MNIDERLEKLTERHEALTQSVESLTHDINEMRGLVGEIAQGTARLLHIAEVHQQRLDSHGDRLDNLEGG
jgi:archaellum component FlaC